MVEQIRTQLFMMLVQQSGSGALPLSNLSRSEFLPFFRRIEESVIFHGLSPVIVYWSTRNAKWLLPENANFRTLTRDAFCVSIFSEDRSDEQDEFCFLVHSQGISMVVHGHCSDESGPERIYQCVGSIDPHLVKRAFQAMISHWQFIDLPEANRLDDARTQVGNPVTAPHFVNGIRHDWPVVKQRAAAGSEQAAAALAGPDHGTAQSMLPVPGGPERNPGNAAVLASASSSLKHPQMVVRPGAEIPLAQNSVALDLNTVTKTTQAPEQRSVNLPPPPPGPPPGKPSPPGGAIARPTQKTPTSSHERISTAASRAPSPLPEPEPASPAIVHGDPSLLEDQFDFQELTNSPLFRPPAGNGGSTAGGGNGKTEPRPGASAPLGRKDSGRGMRELREVWTNITQEARTIFAPDAQKIIRDIVSQLRISSDLPAILDLATEELTKLSRADRGLIWQVVDDQLVVTNEFAQNEHYCFKGANLGAQETTAIVSEFLSRFPDETGTSTIAIADTIQDAKLRRMSPTLAALIELGDARARLVAQIRSRGIFHGFIELQQAGSPREWTEQDGAVLQSVSEVLSLVVQQSFDLMRIEQDANEMKLVNEISEVFRESGGQRAQITIEKAIELFSDHTGFACAQVFLFNEEEAVLVPQISEKEHSDAIPLLHKHNPFIQVFESGKLKTINLEFSKRKDAFFGHDTAMIIPLMSEGERLGVLGLWRRKQGSPMLRPQDRDLAFTVAGNLASIIRAEQANAQVRQKGARESLINSVSEQIQQSLKEVNPILMTLVSQLAEYFDLGLSAVSIFDSLNQKFMEPQCVGSQLSEENSLLSHLPENLFQSQQATLSSPEFLTQPMPALMLDPADVREALGDVIELPETMKKTMVFPLRQGNNLKGALCMVSAQEKTPSLPDMRMIQDLLNRVAVVIEHKELFEKVERQAITDGLTGLYNRRYFEEQLNKELDRHQRFGHSCSYIMLDLDHFKSVNDTLDHGNGDIALKHTAAIVRKCVRDVDTVGRFGGEEFVVLLPESDENAAMVVAQRICTTLRDSVIEQFRSEECLNKIQDKLTEGKINEATAQRLANGRVTASIGVSTFPKDAHDKEKLMELADKYLYLAKGRGRNQVCSYRNDTGEVAPEPKHDTPQARAAEKTQAAAAPQLPAAAAEMVTRGFTAGQVTVPSGTAQIDLQTIAEHGIIGILGNVIQAVSARDGYIDRSPRAADYASRIALNLRLSKEHTTVISLAAVLNNLGKVIVDEQVLRKSGPLSPDEWRLMESAPSTAAKILEPARHLHRVAIVVESYQEHWDGTGYPRGLKGEDIPLESRIISVVDAFVAMTSDRPYRPALSRVEAISILQNGAGKEWDPRIVKLFLAILDKENKA